MIWTALVIGLSGSLHCVGMCGPIALMVPGSKGKKRWLAITLYHAGKILAYMTLGSFFGMIPALLSSFKIQSAITIRVGSTAVQKPVCLGRRCNRVRFADFYHRRRRRCKGFALQLGISRRRRLAHSRTRALAAFALGWRRHLHAEREV